MEIKEILLSAGIDPELSDDQNLVQVGVSSIQLMKVAAKLRKEGYKVSFVDLISQPTFGEWKCFIESSRTDNVVKAPQNIIHHDMHEPFKMTDVQNAYWIGRMSGQSIGKVGCHGYMEVDAQNIDAERLDKAFYELQMHHPMLRVVITQDGQQYIADKPYAEHIKIYDYREKDATKHLEKMREETSHRLLDIYNGQIIALQLTLLPDNKARIHYDVDLLIADVTSFQIILRDLVSLYNGKELPKDSKEFNFAEYILNDEELHKKDYERSKKYWEKRIGELPGKPELPVNDTDVDKPVFERREAFLEQKDWEKFKKLCAEHEVTPARVLLTLYAKVVARYSTKSDFLLNIPLFNRSGEAEGIENAVADFTTLLLIAYNAREGETFLEEIKNIDREFKEGMENTYYSGVAVQRDYLKLHPGEKVVAPIVFSCNIGVPLLNEEFRSTFGDISYMISQTPQVWLDFQLFDIRGGLLMIWDSVKGLFEEGVLDDMFSVYQNTLKKIADLSTLDTKVELDIGNQLKVRDSFVKKGKVKAHGIHEDFFKMAKEKPENIALVDTDGSKVTYKELAELSYKVRGELVKRNVVKGECIGVCLPRGKMQIAALMGILAAGATYVTIGYRQPHNRRAAIIARSEINKVITDNETTEKLKDICEPVNTAEMSDEYICEISPFDASDVAYIIFTSGSTGEPKGVMITHKAAWNTIATINKQYKVNEKDIALQVSQIDFDLSVYDIFGLLSVGGSLVLVPQGKEVDGEILHKLVKENNVTIYNSVPSLLELTVIQAEESGENLDSLRLALNSGDWIPLNLPERFYSITKESLFVSLGGATEGSIWSNYFDVNLPMPANYKSIPYGYPLYNQKYRVMNDRFEDCPDLVPGELWIGGAGVAEGYKGNVTETKNHFVEYDGEKWYRTGDYGRFWKNGIIEFLGRKDNQVKIRGHRIELEEIESAYMKRDDVKQVVVIPIREGGSDYLAAFLVTSKKETEASQLKDIVLSSIGTVLEELRVPTEKGKKYDLRSLDYPEYGRNMISLWYDFLKTEGYVSYNGELWNSEITNNSDITIANDSYLYEDDSYKFSAKFAKHGADLISGKTTVAEALFLDGGLNLQSFIDIQPGAEQKYEYIKKTLKDFVADKEEKQNVLVLTGDYNKGLKKLIGINEKNIKLDIVCPSINALEKISSKIGKDVEDIEVLKMSEEEFIQTPAIDKYDVVISLDYLHRFTDITKSLKVINRCLKGDGKIIFGEVVENSPIQLVTTAYLEDGFSKFRDRRSDSRQPLLSKEEWIEELSLAGFENYSSYQPYDKAYSQLVFKANKPALVDGFKEELEEYISGMVPYYMVPKKVVFLPDIPYTLNGKVDRKVLKAFVDENKVEEERTLPGTELSKGLAAIWKEVLHVPEIYLENDFYLLGGDSLIATRIKSLCSKELGIKISLEDLFNNPVFGDFANIVESKEGIKEPKSEADYGEITIDTASKYETFPLTDVQNAYWIGRSGGYDFGDVSSHCYFEMEAPAVSVTELEKAWNKLICKHDMMRAVILKDGSGQRILEKVEPYSIETIKPGEHESIEEAALIQRKNMADKVYDSSVWPLFEIRAIYKDDKMRLCTSFDNIVFDGFSIFTLFEQWKSITEGKDIEVSKELSFRDYVLKEQSLKESDKYSEDVRYWEEKVENMPGAPELPFVTNNSGGAKESFTRFHVLMDNKKLSAIEKISKKLHLTLPVFFMGAYSEMLAAFSNSNRFTLNLTRFQKYPFHKDVDKLIGDFTTLTLLEIDFRGADSFYERCKRIENQLYKDMEHNYVSGVEVERMIAKKTGNSGVTMPIVFTSGFGINKESAYFGEIVYGQSQTPQVYLDQQISIQNGKLHLSWDAVLSVFPEGFIENMFEKYKKLLADIVDEETVTKNSTNLVKNDDIYEIEARNNNKGVYESKNMLDEYRKNAEKFKDNIAVYSTDKEYTYKELDELSDKVARAIVSSGIAPNNAISVCMEKSAEQIISVLAILKAGCFYVPLDIHNPENRLESIRKQANVVFEITKEYVDGIIDGPDDHVDVKLPEAKPSDIGYVIFTSGSTGVPKGVVITQEAAMNTIDDINQRFDVTEKDGAIFLSNLNFDLSVYDIFGMLSVGGTVVVPDADKIKNPEHWARLLESGEVTIWNSVPTFMQMMLEEKRVKASGALRLILLSGDWIPTKLPSQIYDYFGDVRLISLGGATEGSIWSNYFEIPKLVPNDWESIPYGRPLSNQGFLILSADRDRVPVNVQGELYITGKGVAKGYINDDEKTQNAFVDIEGVEGKAYRTGDYGKYLPDGTIIFCGRKDHQIKRGGHRIELGEIENQILDMNGIKQAAVTFEVSKDSSLTAHIVPNMEETSYIKMVERNVKDPEKWVSTSDLNKTKEYLDSLDVVVKKALAYDLEKWGILDALKNKKSASEIIKVLKLDQCYEGFINNLLGFAAEYKMISGKGQAYQFTDKGRENIEKIRALITADELKAFEKKLIGASDYRLGILRGELDTKELLMNRKDDLIYPDEMGEMAEDQTLYVDYVKVFLKKYKDVLGDGTVYEIGSRTDDHTKQYRELLGSDINYVYLDESLEMINRKKEEQKDLVAYIYRMEESLFANKMAAGGASLVIAENTLHRSKDITKTLKNVRELLIPGGMLILTENTRNQALLFETVAYFEGGYNEFEDLRKDTKRPLLSSEQWLNLAKECGFEKTFTLLDADEEKLCQKNVIVFINKEKAAQIDDKGMRRELSKKVPEYMIPNHFVMYESLPKSANGKIDRKMLMEKAMELTSNETLSAPETPLEIKMAEIWKKLLNVEEIGRDSSFFELGGDSLTAIRFINSYTEKKITLQLLTANPKLSELCYALENEVEEEKEEIWEEEEEIF